MVKTKLIKIVNIKSKIIQGKFEMAGTTGIQTKN